MDLPAGCARQAAWIEENDDTRGLEEGIGDRLGHQSGQRLGRGELLDVARDLHRDADAFTPIPLNGEGGYASLAQDVDIPLNDPLHILRVDVLTAQDDEILLTPDEEDPAPMQEAEVSRPEAPDAVPLDEGGIGGVPVAPIALGEAWAGCHDLADRPIRQAGPVRSGDMNRMVGLRETAIDQPSALLCRHGAAFRENGRVEVKTAHTLAPLARGEEERRFRQTVGRPQRTGIEAGGREAFCELGHGGGADHLRPGEGDLPARQVETRRRLVVDPVLA